MTPIRPALALAALLVAAGPATAQYKVVGPDGGVTYTDRPPVTSNAKITPLNRRGQPVEAPAGAESDLPFDLRQVAQRYPVVLYAQPDCPPCDAARGFLQQRGVPYAERRVTTDDDAAALERAVGGRTVPSVTIGSQALRGLSQGDWTAYLDAAGYPRESKLPRSWKPPVPTPLVERSSATRTAAAAEPPPAPLRDADGEPAPPPAPSIRF